MVMMEPTECGARQRKDRCNSSEVMFSSPVSTSCGGSPTSQRNNISFRAELERKWKSDKYEQSKRRSNASQGSRISFEKTGPQDCGPSGNGKVEERSLSLKQGRKQQKASQSLASKVCLNQMSSESLPDASEVNGDEEQDNLSHSKTFERLVQLSELEEEVLLLHKRLAEELELRTVLESALENSSGALTSFPRHLPISAQELLANITLLEVAVLKLEEQSSALQSEVGQARTEREIAELRLSSSESGHFKFGASDLHVTSSDPNETLRNGHTIPLPGAETESDDIQLKVVANPTFSEATDQQSSPTAGQESERGQKPQKSWKEQRALTLRQDLRLTIPEFPEDDPPIKLPLGLHPDIDPISGRQRQRLKPFWKNNPLEEEEHWIPLNEHHAQAMFAEACCDSPEGCVESVGYAEQDEDTPCFSPAIIAETLRPQSPDLAELAEEVDKSFLPVAEVLWKPSTAMPLPCSKDNGNAAPLATKPESWSFTSEDDHPRPESGSVSHAMSFEDRPWAQLAEAPTLDEQKTKYRIGVMNVREQRRQGILDKNYSDKAKSFGSSQTSISSAKSGVLLSPIWSPVDTEAEKEDGYAEKEDGYESRESEDEMKSDYGLVSSFKSPNELSEEMVKCMISIYRHLANSSCNTGSEESSSLENNTRSSSSPGFTATTNDSSASLSESSLLSITRSPLVDLRSKEVLGNDASPDPFKSRGKLPWADIGPYARVLEVSWLTVGKDQLDFAAQALRNFKTLVELLSRVDPSSLKHEEKLAFWINLYNALLMHAYLAYGIPRSDLKFFSLLQKAAYTVGGHSFNAATMEFCLLRSKSTTHRPQLTLLMSLHKNKLTEDQSKFAIDHPESLVNFGLCSGTRSSPMVRVYTPKHVKSQLEDAHHDYTRASVGISTKGRLLVPKLLYTYAREFVEDSGLLDWICNLLPSNQVAVVFECIQQRRHRFLGSRNFNVLPNDYTFRYIFPAEVFSKPEF